MDLNDGVSLESWTNQRLAVLAVDASWQPDVMTALVRLRNQRAATERGARPWRSFLVAAAVACLWLIVLLSPSSLVRRGIGGPGTLWHRVLEPQAVGASNVIPQKDRKPAPTFKLTDASKKSVALADFRGKVVLLNFWATWCHGCVFEVPWFVEFDNAYREKGLSVVGISMDDDWRKVSAFAAEKKVNYTIALDDGDVSARYHLGAMPMTLLIDRRGNVAATHVGVVSRDDCKSEIEALLRERP